MRKLIALLCAAPLVLAACGGDDNASSGEKAASTPAPSSAASGGGSDTLSFDAVEQGGLSFTKKSLKAKAGSVTLDLKLPSGLKFPHGVAIEGNGVDKDGPVVQAGSDSKLTVDLKPGTYTYYCPVGDHRQEGMEGKLVVQ